MIEHTKQRSSTMVDNCVPADTQRGRAEQSMLEAHMKPGLHSYSPVSRPLHDAQHTMSRQKIWQMPHRMTSAAGLPPTMATALPG